MRFSGKLCLSFSLFLLASASPTPFALSPQDCSAIHPENITLVPRGSAVSSYADLKSQKFNAPNNQVNRMPEPNRWLRPDLVCPGNISPLKKLCKATCFCTINYRIACGRFTDQEINTYYATTNNAPKQMISDMDLLLQACTPQCICKAPDPPGSRRMKKDNILEAREEGSTDRDSMLSTGGSFGVADDFLPPPEGGQFPSKIRNLHLHSDASSLSSDVSSSNPGSGFPRNLNPSKCIGKSLESLQCHRRFYCNPLGKLSCDALANTLVNYTSKSMSMHKAQHAVYQHIQQLTPGCKRLCYCDDGAHINSRLEEICKGTTAAEVGKGKTEAQTNEFIRRSLGLNHNSPTDTISWVPSSPTRLKVPSPTPLKTKIYARTGWYSSSLTSELSLYMQPFTRPKLPIYCWGQLKDDCEAQCYCDPLHMMKCDLHTAKAMEVALATLPLEQAKRIIYAVRDTRTRQCSSTCSCFKAGSMRIEHPYMSKLYERSVMTDIQGVQPALWRRSGIESPIEGSASKSQYQTTSSFTGAKLLQPIIRCTGMPGTNERCRVDCHCTKDKEVVCGREITSANARNAKAKWLPSLCKYWCMCDDQAENLIKSMDGKWPLEDREQHRKHWKEVSDNVQSEPSLRRRSGGGSSATKTQSPSRYSTNSQTASKKTQPRLICNGRSESMEICHDQCYCSPSGIITCDRKSSRGIAVWVGTPWLHSLQKTPGEEATEVKIIDSEMAKELVDYRGAVIAGRCSEICDCGTTPSSGKTRAKLRRKYKGELSDAEFERKLHGLFEFSDEASKERAWAKKTPRGLAISASSSFQRRGTTDNTSTKKRFKHLECIDSKSHNCDANCYCVPIPSHPIACDKKADNTISVLVGKTTDKGIITRTLAEQAVMARVALLVDRCSQFCHCVDDSSGRRDDSYEQGLFEARGRKNMATGGYMTTHNPRSIPAKSSPDLKMDSSQNQSSATVHLGEAAA